MKELPRHATFKVTGSLVRGYWTLGRVRIPSSKLDQSPVDWLPRPNLRQTIVFPAIGGEYMIYGEDTTRQTTLKLER